MKELYYPIAIKLKGRTAVIVGGGQVAERKAQTLLEFGARVRVISPKLTVGLQKLFRYRRITWTRRVVQSSDIKGADIVIAATSDVTVNKNLSKLAKGAGIQVNVVDNPALCSFISPAVFRAGGAVVAVYTHGRDPVLSRDIKNFLREQWDVFLSYRNRS
jgi:precorrin-2 dehydrogenase/sirohydrochlorin ferrochelatase